VPADLVLAGTPIDLARLVDPGKPIVRVRYDLEELPGETPLAEVVEQEPAVGEPRALRCKYACPPRE